MAQKYAEASGSGATDRIEAEGNAILHLSDGTLVYITLDAAVGNLVLKYTTDRSTLNTIASWGTASTTSPVAATYGAYQALTLCRDASDNIYVIGAATANIGYIGVQAYVKGAGYTWVQKTMVTSSLFAQTIYSMSAVWCNTGGGTNSKGHLIVVGGNSGPTGFYEVLDAGVALAGTGTLVIGGGTNPAFLNGGNAFASTTSAQGGNLDISPDGFGATSGLATANGGTGTNVFVGAWAINSSGALTTNTSITSYTVANMNSGTTKLRLVRVSPNKWAFVAPSAVTAGGWQIATLSSTAQITGLTDAGIVPNFYFGSATLGWDVFNDPGVANKVWVVSNDSVGNKVLAIPANVSTGVVWGTVAIPQDIWSPFYSVSSVYDIRVVKQPVVSTYIDYQQFIETASTPTYALLGNYTTPSILSTPPAGQKYAEATSANTNDRIGYSGNAMVQLSDGTLVYLTFDLALANWLLRYTTDRSTLNTIASWAGNSTGNPVVYGAAYQALTICRDASDNIYVIGSTSNNTVLGVQAYVKGAGYTWTQQTMVTYNAGLVLASMSAVWCNTGGGTNAKGHIMLLSGFGTTTIQWISITLNAGVALAGTGTVGVVLTQSPTFLCNGYSPSIASIMQGGNFDISPDGFGATSGLATSCAYAANIVYVGAWAINSSGALTTNVNITSYTVANLTNNTKIRLVRYAPNKWALVVPSPTTAGFFAIATLSSTAQITGLTQCPNITNGFYVNSNSLGWDTFNDPSTPNKVWVFVQDSNAYVSGASVAVASGITWDTAATVQDYWSPWYTNSTYDLRVVKQPVVSTYVDYQSFIETTSAPTYALLGDYTTFALPVLGRRGFNATIKGRRGRGVLTSF